MVDPVNKGLDVATDAVLRDVVRLYARAQRQSVACCGEETAAQCQVLGELARGGPLQLTALARRLGADKGWTSRAVTAMASAGYLKRAGSPEDGRVVNVALTRVGRVRWRTMDRALDRHASQILLELAPADRSEARRCLGLIRAVLQAQDSRRCSPQKPPLEGGQPHHRRGPVRGRRRFEGQVTAMELTFGDALPSDGAEVRAFLRAAGLPAEDVEAGPQQYLLAREGRRLVGTVGLEMVGEDALARSLAVVPDRRGEGIGSRLVETVVERARVHGIRTLYALTTTAERYAAARGFERIPRSEVPPGIAALAQFRALCPAAAVCLRRILG